jgi:hypothetical protein
MTGYHADGEALTSASRELTAAADALHSAFAALDRSVGAGSLGSDRLTTAAASFARSTAGDLAGGRDALNDSAQRVAAALAGYQDADDEARSRLRRPQEPGTG